MAEVIGILSGAVTFIDAGNKLLRFLSDLRHAPQKIEAHQHHLRTMLQLVQGIRRDLDRLSNGTGALKKAGELESIFNGLVGRSDITTLERSWKSLRAQDRILERFQDLTMLKDLLQTWLNRQTLLLASRHKMSLEALGQNTINTIEAAESSLIRAISASQDNFNHEFGKLKDQNKMIIQLISRQSRLFESRPIYPGVSQPIFPRVASSVHLKNQLVIPPTCTCTSRPAPWNMYLGPFSFRSRTKNVHSKGCPLHGRSARTVTLSVNLSILQFVLNGSHGSNGVSFSQSIKSPARIVDRSRSPAFQMMQTFNECLSYMYTPELAVPSAATGLFDELIRKLVRLFREGTASVHDQDQSGLTLVLEFAWIVTSLRRFGSSEGTTSVIATLANHGADIDCCNRTLGSPLDRCFSPFIGVPAYARECVSLESLFLSYGCKPQKDTNLGGLEDSTFYVIISCSRNSELARGLGFPNYYYPIFDRSAADLHALVRQGRNWNEWDRKFPAPVSCAVCWPEGLEILIDAGADICYALATALKCGTEDTVQLLVSMNCPAFVDRPFGGYSHFSIAHWIDFDNVTTAETAIRHISRTREALSQLGLKYLPPGTHLHNHLLEIGQKGTVLDEFAFKTWKTLKARAVEVPEHLWPGTSKSVYFELLHNFSKATSREIVAGARLLYENGFKELNIVDERGWTPLLLACSYDKIDVVDFLLERGARKDPDCQWVYAMGGRKPESILVEAFSEACPFQRDACNCYCSPSGCLPLVHSLKNRMAQPWMRKTFRNAICKILSNFSPESKEIYFFEASRLEVFERLGMAHTCCKDSKGSPSKISMQEFIARRNVAAEDIEEMKEEDRELLSVLSEFMKLFNELRASFKGSAHDFQSAWWAALDILLPPDAQQAKRATEKEPGAHLIHGATVMDPEKSWVDEQGFRAITQHFYGLLPSITGFVEVLFRANTMKIIEEYVKSMGVSLRDMDYYDWQMPSIARIQSTFVDPIARRCLESSTERFRKEQLEPKLIPLTTAAVIKDIDAGCEAHIPPELYDYLVSDGAIVDGKLRARWRTDNTVVMNE